MSEEPSPLEGEPTDSSVDIINAVRRLSPIRVLRVNVRRIRELLKAAQTGIEDNRSRIGGILAQLSGSPAPTESGNEHPQAGRLRPGGAGAHRRTVELDDDDVELLRKVLITRIHFLRDWTSIFITFYALRFGARSRDTSRQFS